jgi:hypothetical protein
LASLHRRDLRRVGLDATQAETVAVRTLDDWSREQAISRVHLLKIDVEGAELGVLLGARSLLATGGIRYIQFEFGGTDIDSRVFLRDFLDLLGPSYSLHRMLPAGLSGPVRYSERYEIFVLQNYLAVRT